MRKPLHSSGKEMWAKREIVKPWFSGRKWESVHPWIRIKGFDKQEMEE
jgi:hypothetical protein